MTASKPLRFAWYIHYLTVLSAPPHEPQQIFIKYTIASAVSLGEGGPLDREAQKQAVAAAAVEWLRDKVAPDTVLGVGSGSTVRHFIAALAASELRVAGAVAASESSAELLRELDIEVVDLNEAGELSVYVDGADEADRELRLIKGGGGALLREKIIAEASREFLCLVDEGKVVERLGAFPLPVEVLPMARAVVERALRGRGGEPVLRAGYRTDNGNEILDVLGLDFGDPEVLEGELNQLPGVVGNGVFARRGADCLLVAGAGGVREVGGERSSVRKL